MIEQPLHILFKFLDVIPLILSILVLTGISWLTASTVGKILKKLMPRKIDPALRSFIPKATKVVIFVIGIIMSLSIVGMSANSITATIGLGAVAIGMSLKDLFVNMIQGIVILTSHPFKIGDEVTIKEQTGIVQKIDLLHTRLDCDGEIKLVPNTVMFSEIIGIKKTW